MNPSRTSGCSKGNKGFLLQEGIMVWSLPGGMVTPCAGEKKEVKNFILGLFVSPL
jgi:hypothetical protein